MMPTARATMSCWPSRTLIPAWAWSVTSCRHAGCQQPVRVIPLPPFCTTSGASRARVRRERKDDISIRVITDHIRATVFIAPTASCPSNETAATSCAVCCAAPPAPWPYAGHQPPVLTGGWSKRSSSPARPVTPSCASMSLISRGHRHRGAALQPHHRRRSEHPDRHDGASPERSP